MSISRREFLEYFGQTAALTVFPSLATAQAQDTMSQYISIIQGDAFDGHSQFCILSISRKQFRFFIYDDNTPLQEIKSAEIKYPRLNSRIDKIFVKGLQVEKEYQLRIFEDNKLVDLRYFKSLSSKKTQHRVAVLSCMDDRMHDAPMWESLAQVRPDLILFIGDSVYADSVFTGPAKPMDLWVRFANARFTLDVFKWKKLIPILSVWDDHDFGANNSGKSYPYIKESQNNFRNFYAQDYSCSPNLFQGPGIAKAFRLSNILFFMLDDRSFRDNVNSTDLNAMWGRDQEHWLLYGVKNHNGPVVLINGSQWFSESTKGESFSHDYPANFRQFLGSLKALNKKIVFISGDVHFSELIQIPKDLFGYNTLEITSSSMHSLSIPGTPQVFNTHNSIVSTWRRNFMLLEFQTSNQFLKLSTHCIGYKGSQFFENKLIL